MLFNSYLFIFGFLPLTLAGFFLLGRHSSRLALTWLMVASVVFHAWWDWRHTALMICSIAFNFLLGVAIQRALAASAERVASAALLAGVAVNLGLLAYFKYAAFLLSNLAGLAPESWQWEETALPLGISFFTFTQIAFLVDVRQRKARDYDPVHFGLFVTYFPHLLAGPIIHHREIMPQFATTAAFRPRAENFALGLSIFFAGLFKKVVLADGCIPYVEPVFASQAMGALHFFQAWGAAFAYALQLYFDFSGYSDMAIGLSLLFGIRLPMNFFSPYRATSIIEFWRRWHMTLSRFLKDYLYIPLGGNRRGAARRYLNLMATMLLGGLWHGASWNFVVWGGLHGLLLAINHGFRHAVERFGWRSRGRLYGVSGWALTFVAVTACWVVFRANDLPSAWAILAAMSGANGVVLPGAWGENPNIVSGWPGIRFAGDFDGGVQLAWTATLMAIVGLAPNTMQWMSRFRVVLDPVDRHDGPRFRLDAAWAIALGAIAWVCLLRMASGSSRFIYYNF